MNSRDFFNALLATTLLTSPALAIADGHPATICIVTPKAQLGQGTDGADPSGPVLDTIVSYLSGPATSIIPLQSRIDVQIKAEAQELGCGFVLKTSVTQKKAGKGFGGLLAAAPALMGAVPYMGGGAGSYQAAAVASAAVEGAAAAEQAEAQQSAMEAMSGVAQSNIKKGDQISLEYTFSSMAGAAPVKAKLNRKAADNGEDVLSPMIEEMANAVLNAALAPAG